MALSQREAEGLRQEAVALRLAQHESTVQSRANAAKRDSLQQQARHRPWTYPYICRYHCAHWAVLQGTYGKENENGLGLIMARRADGAGWGEFHS